MTNNYRQQAEELQKQIEIMQEKAILFERLAELEGDPVPKIAKAPAQAKAVNGKVAAPKVKVATPKKKGGDKAGGDKAGGDKADRAGVPTDDGKVMDLPTLLEHIGANVKKPLKQADFVTMVREAGYATKAKDFSNMVYQALLKLVKRKVFEKNDETREYVYIGKQAA